MSRSVAAQQGEIAAVAHGERLSLPASNPFALARRVPFGGRISSGIAGDKFDGQFARGCTVGQRIKHPKPLDQPPVLSRTGSKAERELLHIYKMAILITRTSGEWEKSRSV